MSATVQWLRPEVIEPADPDRITSLKICEAAGITYRQLDFWTRCALIPGTAALQKAMPGSGQQRQWTTEQRAFVVRLAEFVRSGMPPGVVAEALKAQTFDVVLPDVLRVGNLEIRILSTAPVAAVAQ